MKRILFLTTILAATHFDLFAQQSKQVLFIGNSYTGNHDIPALVSGMATSVGNTLVYTAHTPGGAQLSQHATNANVDALIRSGGWDAVVLQEQSQLPSFRQADVRVMVFPYATQLVDKVRGVDPCTEVIFYNTWGRQRGDNQNCSYYPVVCTYEGMDDELFTNYHAMAVENKATLSPVGRVWRYLRANNPNINLYEGDESHQNTRGAYAIAMTFNTIIFGTKPADVTYAGSISTAESNAIKEAVTAVVYDSLFYWKENQMVKDPVADFSTSNQELNYKFEVVNQVPNNTYVWYINDSLQGINGVLLNHSFTTSGTYNVCLEVKNECRTVKNCITVTVENTTSIHDASKVNLSIHPNPTTGLLNIKTDVAIAKVFVYDVYGGVIMQSTENTIDISTLNTGMYIIKVQDINGGVGVKQIVKQ